MSGTAASIVYVTCREEPAFEWFADGLAAQLGDGDDVEIVIVDGRHSSLRSKRWAEAAGGRFALRHVPAKPSPYQGRHRLTVGEYFAASSARNSGLVHASKPYVVFVDDAALPTPGWWDAAAQSARNGIVVSGAYQKHWEMRVEQGILVASRSEPGGIDSRWALGDPRRPVPIGGGQLFGTSIGAPRELLLEVNGFDELCDSIGGEDCNLGLRLEFAGAALHYDRRMLMIESEELNRNGLHLLRIDPELSPTAYLDRLDEFGVRRRHTTGRCDSSHMLLDVVYGTQSPATHGNYYCLADLTEATLDGIIHRFPRAHWFDRRPLDSL